MNNGVIKRSMKNVIKKLFDEAFIELKDFLVSEEYAIICVEIPSIESVSEVLNILYCKSEEYVKNQYLTEQKFFKEGFAIKAVA